MKPLHIAYRSFCALLAFLLVPMLYAAEEPEQKEYTFFLANSDHVNGRLLKIQDGKAFFTFHSTAFTKSLIKLDLRKLEHLDFGNERLFRKDSYGERLLLRDGSLLYGSFIKLTDRSLHFEVEEMGLLEVPRSEIAKLIRKGDDPGKSDVAPEAHVVATAEGDLLWGDLSQQEGGTLTISRKDLKATVRITSVVSVIFPVSARPPEKDERLMCRINTRRGSLIAGTDPKVEQRGFSLVPSGGRRVTVPIDNIVDVSFGTNNTRYRRGILAWGAHCDRNDEYRKTINIIKKYLPAWRITEDFSKIDANFKKELMRSRVLLIPEQEKWTAPTSSQATLFKPLAEAFLSRGGTIIFLGVNNFGILGFLKTAELFDLDLVEYNRNPDSQGATVPFTEAGRKIAKGIGTSFVTVNSTYFLAIKKRIKATAFARSASGAPIVARRAGRGWIIAMGMDYHEHSKQTERLLINAITGLD